MSKKFLVNIDLNKNQIQNAVVQPLATAPSSPALGQIYYNSGDKKLYQYNGTSWEIVGATPYTLPAATSSALGGVKSGGDITVASDGTVSVNDDSHNHIIANVDNLQTTLDAKAPLASPAFTGTPTAPTAAATANSTQIATTAFVKTAINNAVANLPADQFLDLAKTTYVDSFTWSSTTYPGSTNPNLNGKAVLVLALTNGTTTTYSFISLNDLVDAYTGDNNYIEVSNGTIKHKTSGVSAKAYGEPAARTVHFGSALIFPYFTVDAYGHITTASTKSITISDETATTSEAGLMSAVDKQNLDKVVADMQNVLIAGEVTLAAGQTYVDAGIGVEATKIQYNAYDATTYEEVMVDCGVNSRGKWEFSIATTYANNIDIVYSYMATIT